MNITVYSLPIQQCVACRGTEIALRRWKVAHTKVMLNETPEAMDIVKDLGYSSAPVVIVEVDGQIVDHWGGYRETKIAEWAAKVAA